MSSGLNKQSIHICIEVIVLILILVHINNTNKSLKTELSLLKDEFIEFKTKTGQYINFLMRINSDKVQQFRDEEELGRKVNGNVNITRPQYKEEKKDEKKDEKEDEKEMEEEINKLNELGGEENKNKNEEENKEEKDNELYADITSGNKLTPLTKQEYGQLKKEEELRRKKM
jgi:hypothetical protein